MSAVALDEASPVALELRGVRKAFGKTEIIRGVDLAIRRGERVAVIGPNGAGKSTLFNLISGRYEPTAGHILLNGEDITGKRPYEIYRRGLARSFQITNIFPRLTVFENLRCAALYASGQRYCFWRALSSLKDLNARTEALMQSIELKRRRDVAAASLTYSEQRALELGLTIAGNADVILLDEPTAGMSHSETGRFVELIRNVTQGRTLVMVEHDMSVVFELADRIAVLVYGEVIAFDTPERVRADPRVQEAYLGALLEAQAPAAS
ncbi:MAG: ABC transporter ATP-binding protein [Casimicrobiaceae bacterium]|nr:ABC transporter ATP-binding protein [Casimicrobiaceae bacterium]MCX8098045.1 ABC transporter ATP-binding protein [Casimicrobiaceae bacterium]MDW8312427.1 ABC transporter ATP-binding protein [Burkholderiales bacterium]